MAELNRTPPQATSARSIGYIVRRYTRLYTILIRAAWQEMLEYRIQSLLWILTGGFPFVMMAVWLTITSETGSVGSKSGAWNASDFVTYYLLAAVVRHIVESHLSQVWDHDIRMGELSAKLLKPLHPLHYYLTLRMLGWKLFMGAALIPLVIFFGITSGMVRLSPDPVLWIAFLVSLVLALFNDVFLASIIGVLGFWTTQTHNLSGVINGVGQFMAGYIAPLALFPAWFQAISNVLPFRFTLGFPIETIMGRLSYSDVLAGLGMSAVWTLAFFLVYGVLYRRGIRRYEGVGA